MKITIKGVDYTAHLVLPFTTKQSTMTDELPSATLELVGLTIKKPFQPLTYCDVEIDGVTTRWLIASDNIDCTYGRGVYKHTIQLIDLTKRLERIVCGAKSFTKPLIKNYLDAQNNVSVQKYIVATGQYSTQITQLNGVAPVFNYSNVFQIPSWYTIGQAFPDAQGDFYSMQLFYNRNTAMSREMAQSQIFTQIELPEELSNYDIRDFADTLTTPITLSNGIGVYTIVVRRSAERSDGETTERRVEDVLYIPLVASVKATAQTYTYEQIVDILLKTAKAKRRGDALEFGFSFDGVDAAQEAPEFAFSDGRTLFENLNEIAKALGCKVRLKYENNAYTVHFVQMTQPVQADFSAGVLVDIQENQNIEDYATAIESNAQNLINDELDGQLYEPSYNGFKSIRATDARITADTGIISTDFPVWKIIKVICKYNGVDYDISKYIYEADAYDTLSSFSDVYPLSKCYALRYQKGAPNITALNYKIEDSALQIANAFKKPAIENILKKCGASITGEDWWKGIANQLSFNVTYIPMINARIRQQKIDGEGMNESILTYNQASNRLSARQYGENMRGQIAMLGTTNTILHYAYKHFADVESAGKIANETDFITDVTARVYPHYTIATYTLTTDYNGIGQYVSLPSDFRQYEIPTSIERNILLEEFVNISAEQKTDDADTIVAPALKAQIVKSLTDKGDIADTINAVFADTYQGDKLLAKVKLPMYVTPFGNSAFFTFHYADNFSAGSKAVPTMSDTLDMTEFVGYGDIVYGKADELRFRAYASTTAYDAKQLPDADGLTEIGANSLLRTGAKPITILKDGAEALNIGYQLHFVSDDGILIGAEFARAMNFAGYASAKARLRMAIYDTQVNRFTLMPVNTLSLDTALYNGDNDHITGTPPTSANQKSWVLYYVEFDTENEQYKQVPILAKNTTEAPPSNIYFNFKRGINNDYSA